ncbi:hypothetical protein K8T06_00120 [bacterium]|nr:hypothetical protein [bacterium]
MKKCFVFAILVVSLNAMILRAAEPVTYDISYIRQHLSELNGERVRLENVVCFVETGRIGTMLTIVQDAGGGPWSGTSIHDNDERLSAARGDTVTVVGEVMASNGTFVLSTSTETEYPPVVTGNAPISDPLDITCSDASELKYIDCLIQLKNIEVITVPDVYANIDIKDRSGSQVLLLSKYVQAPAPGYMYGWMTGYNGSHAGEIKIRPRDENDWGSIPFLGVEINMPLAVHPGETFYVNGLLHNPESTLDNVPVFFFLGIDGVYWFWPTFISSMDGTDYMSMDVLKGTTEIEIISQIIWPDTGDLSMQNLAFYGAMLNAEMTGILGDFAEVNWQFGP